MFGSRDPGFWKALLDLEILQLLWDMTFEWSAKMICYERACHLRHVLLCSAIVLYGNWRMLMDPNGVVCPYTPYFGEAPCFLKVHFTLLGLVPLFRCADIILQHPLI
jgi:hypothetical protein